MTQNDLSNRRTEPRFHTGRQSLHWHHVDEAGSGHSGWLADISLRGIRIYAAATFRKVLELADRLEVHEYPGGPPKYYEVVWVGKERNNCEIGCTRIFPSPRRGRVRSKPAGSAAINLEEQETLALAA